ncbi:hypothetical protein BDA96_05G192400 [Sorghum bicolor]|uniref:Uncharacterized protein n=2 Tax=Sorghum bicolor TaxID=4558 RepID=A0A921QZ87_SORBI|nr:hypothetical protein BDA96_05G192400 [Sorghum bicolor]KXG28865.1 hypothetical protein SORBI_3005G176500 [Sorghum bicolor]
MTRALQLMSAAIFLTLVILSCTTDADAKIRCTQESPRCDLAQCHRKCQADFPKSVSVCVTNRNPQECCCQYD